MRYHCLPQIAHALLMDITLGDLRFQQIRLRPHGPKSLHPSFCSRLRKIAAIYSGSQQQLQPIRKEVLTNKYVIEPNFFRRIPSIPNTQGIDIPHCHIKQSQSVQYPTSNPNLTFSLPIRHTSWFLSPQLQQSSRTTEGVLECKTALRWCYTHKGNNAYDWPTVAMMTAMLCCYRQKQHHTAQWYLWQSDLRCILSSPK